jgi:hypothetical protein
MAEEGFAVCASCQRAWDTVTQKACFVKVRDDDKSYVFCADDMNCAAVYALSNLDAQDVTVRARALIAKRKKFRR